MISLHIRSEFSSKVNCKTLPVILILIRQDRYENGNAKISREQLRILLSCSFFEFYLFNTKIFTSLKTLQIDNSPYFYKGCAGFIISFKFKCSFQIKFYCVVLIWRLKDFRMLHCENREKVPDLQISTYLYNIDYSRNRCLWT